MNKKKVIIILLVSLLLIVSIYFFYKNNYKKGNFGNTITKSQENIEEYILNMSSYEAKVEVTINNNKNTTRYQLKQQYCEPNIFSQEVIEPENIAGLKTILEGEQLKIENSKLTLTEIYENYQYINENFLNLYDFIQDYKENTNNTEFSKRDDEIIMQAKVRQENPYIVYKKLYLDAKTGLPKKLEVQDNNQKTLVYILYKEIKINSTNKESVIAFRLSDAFDVNL